MLADGSALRDGCTGGLPSLARPIKHFLAIIKSTLAREHFGILYKVILGTTNQVVQCSYPCI